MKHKELQCEMTSGNKTRAQEKSHKKIAYLLKGIRNASRTDQNDLA